MCPPEDDPLDKEPDKESYDAWRKRTADELYNKPGQYGRSMEAGPPDVIPECKVQGLGAMIYKIELLDIFAGISLKHFMATSKDREAIADASYELAHCMLIARKKYKENTDQVRSVYGDERVTQS